MFKSSYHLPQPGVIRNFSKHFVILGLIELRMLPSENVLTNLYACPNRCSFLSFLSYDNRDRMLVFLLTVAVTALLASSQTYVSPSSSPFQQSDNYVGKSNGTIKNSPLVKGAQFDRFIQSEWKE